MRYLLDVLTFAGVLAIAVHGFMLIKGLGGLLHFGHAVFYGLGAYTSAILATKVLPPGTFPLAIVASAVVAVVGAYLIGWPALRERGRYFMIVTFAMQLMFVNVVINLGITGGVDGISSIPRMSLGPWQLASNTTVSVGSVALGAAHINFVLVACLMVASFLFCRHVISSPYGRLVRATREDELAVEAYGRSAIRIKLSILAIGAGLAGAAGSIFAHYFNYVGHTQFELDLVVLFLLMLVLGGESSLVGATVGAAAAIALLEILRFVLENILEVDSTITAHVRQVAFSVLLVLVLVVRPAGLFRERHITYRRSGTRPKAETKDESHTRSELVTTRGSAVGRISSESRGDAPLTTSAPILSCTGLEKSFGGIAAVGGAGFELHQGKILAIIGPNGAGKTTVFNILSGFERPDAGDVFVRSTRITGMKPDEIARIGVARTFQDVRIWPRLTVIENVLASAPRQPGENPLRLFFSPSYVKQTEARNVADAWSLLERFGLAEKANQLAGELSYAQKKMLALGRLIAFRAEVLLLDEPTAGVDPKRLDTFLTHIREFAATEGRTICLVEHNMTVVRELADWVLFMENGRVVAGGRPDDVLRDQALMASYLGKATEH